MNDSMILEKLLETAPLLVSITFAMYIGWSERLMGMYLLGLAIVIQVSGTFADLYLSTLDNAQLGWLLALTYLTELAHILIACALYLLIIEYSVRNEETTIIKD